MKLKATVNIHFEAADFLQAGEWQTEIMAFVKAMEKKGAEVTHEFRERRETRGGAYKGRAGVAAGRKTKTSPKQKETA